MFDLVRSNDTLGLSTFEEMDRLLDNFWRSAGLPVGNVGLPSIDIYSTDDSHMVVEIQAPGFDIDDIDISVRDNVLQITGNKIEKEEDKANKKNYLVRERSASFARRVLLPEGAEAENISAELDKGLLKISVPVKRPQAKRIQIKASEANNRKEIKASKN